MHKKITVFFDYTLRAVIVNFVLSAWSGYGVGASCFQKMPAGICWDPAKYPLMRFETHPKELLWNPAENSTPQ